ncbi:hypothetical protein JJD41_08005 [Oxynema sp. CENA135]|uniref:hypothetical protein n=1 Tax=Oxynema sp. CENA135 TaxID=984206 RepID=UPI00190C308D|nr:hypothetical protein [Oxynema sp. CENA135]MBK4729807.1 hypothetical protein [Oxynema sp. CENA135]
MSSNLDRIQTLIADIDGVLRKMNSRLAWWRSGDTRQVLERVRDFLQALRDRETQSGTLSTPRGDRPTPPSLDEARQWGGSEMQAQQILTALVRDMTALRSNLLHPLQAELAQLQEHRETLIQDIRQLEEKHQAKKSLAAQNADRDRLIAEFLQALMAQLQDRLSEEVSETLGHIETQLIAPSRRSSGGLSRTGDTGESAPLDLELLDPQDRLEYLKRIQAQSDRLLISLDSSLQVVFEAIEKNIKGYQESLSDGLDKMHRLGQQGELMVAALVNHLAQQLGREASSYWQSSLKLSGVETPVAIATDRDLFPQPSPDEAEQGPQAPQAGDRAGSEQEHRQGSPEEHRDELPQESDRVASPQENRDDTPIDEAIAAEEPGLTTSEEQDLSAELFPYAGSEFNQPESAWEDETDLETPEAFPPQDFAEASGDRAASPQDNPAEEDDLFATLEQAIAPAPPSPDRGAGDTSDSFGVASPTESLRERPSENEQISNLEQLLDLAIFTPASGETESGDSPDSEGSPFVNTDLSDIGEELELEEEWEPEADIQADADEDLLPLGEFEADSEPDLWLDSNALQQLDDDLSNLESPAAESPAAESLAAETEARDDDEELDLIPEAWIQELDNVEDSLEENFEDNLDEDFEENLGDSLEQNFEDNLDEDFEENLGENLGDSLEEDFEDNLDEDFDEDFEDNLEDNFDAFGESLSLDEDAWEEETETSFATSETGDLDLDALANLGEDSEIGVRVASPEEYRAEPPPRQPSEPEWFVENNRKSGPEVGIPLPTSRPTSANTLDDIFASFGDLEAARTQDEALESETAIAASPTPRGDLEAFPQENREATPKEYRGDTSPGNIDTRIDEFFSNFEQENDEEPSPPANEWENRSEASLEESLLSAAATPKEVSDATLEDFFADFDAPNLGSSDAK